MCTAFRLNFPCVNRPETWVSFLGLAVQQFNNSPGRHAIFEELLHLLIGHHRPRRQPLHKGSFRRMLPHPQPMPASSVTKKVTNLLVVYLHRCKRNSRMPTRNENPANHSVAFVFCLCVQIRFVFLVSCPNNFSFVSADFPFQRWSCVLQAPRNM